ncbi:hypothetical protein HJG60_010228 [Phyllostomus discolor]|uniref:Uncharacterized protein n=1 Tax=Phyllostomus discolor TaxID=89673 RepID=A0A834EMQ6_9CHIR|nr:hypothetical protein HJG60_010228 [Phyllostomus discolor]
MTMMLYKSKLVPEFLPGLQNKTELLRKIKLLFPDFFLMSRSYIPPKDLGAMQILHSHKPRGAGGGGLQTAAHRAQISLILDSLNILKENIVLAFSQRLGFVFLARQHTFGIHGALMWVGESVNLPQGMGGGLSSTDVMAAQLKPKGKLGLVPPYTSFFQDPLEL